MNTDGTDGTADTAQYSLQHWSEAGRREMEAFYALATEDYRQLALAADWPTLLRGVQRPGWRLLDVACGSGKFPTALLDHHDLSGLAPIAYDLLDPSPFSIAEARSKLRTPFEAATEFGTTLEDVPDSTRAAYDVVWATHALYAIPPADLPRAMAAFAAALRPGGLGFVAHATAASHYLAFYDAYRAGIGERTPYNTAEQVRDALREHGADVRTETVHYTSGTTDRAVAEGFLQRCAFDDTVTLEQMEAAPVLGDYLASCRDGDGYTFRHEVMLIRL